MMHQNYYSHINHDNDCQNFHLKWYSFRISGTFTTIHPGGTWYKGIGWFVGCTRRNWDQLSKNTYNKKQCLFFNFNFSTCQTHLVAKKPVIRSNSNSFLTDTRPADSSFACACLIKSWHHEKWLTALSYWQAGLSSAVSNLGLRHLQQEILGEVSILPFYCMMAGVDSWIIWTMFIFSDLVLSVQIQRN